MQLDLSDEQLNGVVTGAILQALSPETREALIAGAIKELFEKEPGGGTAYRSGTRLQEAFTRAATAVAGDVCKEVLQEPKHRDAIKAVVSDALTLALTDEKERQGLVTKLAMLVTEVVSGNLEKRY